MSQYTGKLFIDQREDNKIITKIVDFCVQKGINFEMRINKVGDYIWDEQMVIERKTVTDFVHSIRDGRLETQLLDMEQYDRSYLFISGSWKDLYFKGIKNWTVSHTVGSICSILARYDKVKIGHFDNDNQLIQAIFTIKEKTDKGLKIDSVGIRHSKSLNVINPSFACFFALPGIGEDKARKYIEIYPSFFNFLIDYKNGNLKMRIPKATDEFLKGVF